VTGATAPPPPVVADVGTGLFEAVSNVEKIDMNTSIHATMNRRSKQPPPPTNPHTNQLFVLFAVMPVVEGM
jgi:hypothetical protein